MCGNIVVDKEKQKKLGGNKMTKQTIKEIKTLLKDLDLNIENDSNASFYYWKASKLLHEHLVNVYSYNTEKIDFGYILYKKESFKIFNDNLYYVFLAIQQKNITIKSFMLAYSFSINQNHQESVSNKP